MLLGLSYLQFSILFVVFISCVITTERAFYITKRENIKRIVFLLSEQNMCNVCLVREEKRLKKLGAIDVELIKYRLEKEMKSLG